MAAAAAAAVAAEVAHPLLVKMILYVIINHGFRLEDKYILDHINQDLKLYQIQV